jgi:hypothetical protein
MLTKSIQQAHARLDSQRPRLAVDGQRDRLASRELIPSRWRGNLAIHGNLPFIAHPDTFIRPA